MHTLVAFIRQWDGKLAEANGKDEKIQFSVTPHSDLVNTIDYRLMILSFINLQ